MSEQAAPEPTVVTGNPNANPETLNGIPANEAHDISMTDAPATTTHISYPPYQLQILEANLPPSAPAPQSNLQKQQPSSAIPTPIPSQTQPQLQLQPRQQQQQQQQSTSRAPSQHPDPAAPTMGSSSSSSTTTTTTTTTVPAPPGPIMPTEATPHGAPVRQYINSKITGVLLEGMKIVAREQPKDPLRVLGEFLLHRSKELEGKDGVSGSGL
ncbi:hypothetical protein N658DRAFT_445417 [Parathielavia hyrcaniae]|uniref:Dpy-30 domain-containing protein n=1 Tax=Parathielavia hyrcaniae TaxID=113614 RepID=A0AAN6Q3S4_9PEZI|nr:hypothetical protein N658DRAFT_445417 [Parathielavia hyrcaniae]